MNVKNNAKKDAAKDFLRMIEVQGKPTTAEGNLSEAGLPHGDWTYWHENGMKMAEGNLREGKPHGAWKTYDEGGTLQSESYWNDGKPSGRWVVYDDAGRVDRLYHHDHAEMDADQVRFKLDKPELPA